MTGNTLPRLQTEDVEELLVPIPSESEQKAIISKLWEAKEKKREMEKEINKILASIDGYVLGELGIENVMGGGERIFQIWSDAVSNRLDPIYLRDYTILKKLNPKYRTVPLESVLSSSPQYGANESAVEDGGGSRDTRYIRITDIDEFGDLKNDSWKTARKTEDKYLLEDGDLLFARSGATAGKSFLYKEAFGKAIFAGYLIRFKLDQTKADPDYVFSFTRTTWYALWVRTIQRPSGQPNINSEEFKSLEIPLPPLPVQKKIAKEVRSRRSKVEELKRQMEATLLSAKEQVERMLLA